MSALSVAEAHGTLSAGTRFLIDRAGSARLSAPWPGDAVDPVRCRYVGNCLGEIDRFFHLLLDALDPAAPPGRHNAALKLSTLQRASVDDDLRLRAIGRSRACLRYNGGKVGKPDATTVAWMTAGWLDPETGRLQRYVPGARLRPLGGEIMDVCRFYDRLAAALVNRTAG